MQREVTFPEASTFAKENDLMFIETSALSGDGVEEVFLQCAKAILTKIDSGTIDVTNSACGVQVREAQPIQPGPANEQQQQCAC